MQCPRCHRDNAAGARSCAQCGAEFPDAIETRVISSVSPSPGARPPVSPRPFSDVGMASTAGAYFALEAGADFGPRYRIEGVLGEGGMGKVYKAYDRDLNRVVALKLVRPEYAIDPGSMQRLKQELLLASKVSHKNVLRIHDLGDVGGVKFISMAYVEGEDLHDVIRKQGRLPLERVMDISRQLCAALEAAHGEEVVHRDLKPRNILVDHSGTVYVSDFGLAKSLEAGATMMTRTGQILGTPAYMSPEQCEARPADHRSDIYSLGLILYEMVTGDLPFVAESTLQLMYQQVHEKPKSPRVLNPDVPEHLSRIILKCLEKDPAQRYQSTREMLQDLEAARAPSHSLILEIPKPTRRGWLAVAGAVLALLILVLAVQVARRVLWPSAAKRAAGAEKYLAVLPFRVLGEQEPLKYEADGVVEALGAKLSALRTVHLASPAAVEKVNLRDPLEKIARTLGVKLVVQGALRGTGDRVSVMVSLDDVAARRQLWSEEISGLRQDLLTIEDQIYDKLVSALGLKLSNEEMARGAMRPTEDFEAYELYLKSRNILRGRRDEKQISAAMDLFNQAVQKDRRFALAYTGLADASLMMYQLKKDNSWTAKALGAAQQAQRLNDGLPEVHLSLGSVYRLTGRQAEAIAELKRALELAPNSDEGYRRLGSAYLAAGRKEEAVQAFQKAVEVNPYYSTHYNLLGSAYLQSGENEKALAAFRRVTELEPDNASGYANMGVVYYRQGKWNECIPAFQKALERQPSYSVYSNLGTAYFYLGQYGGAVKMFEKAVEMNPNQQVAVGNLADAYRWSGQQEKAVATYDRAISLAYKAFQVNPRDAGTLGSLALYYAKKGDAGRAREFIGRARAIDRNDNALAYNEAVIHALGGRKAETLQGLREAFQKGYPAREAQNDPELKNLRSDVEFDRLIAEFRRSAN